MIQQRLLDILVCPACKGELTHVTEPDEELHCKECQVAYAVRDGIPDMIIEDARSLSSS